jgi:hypothetical protein
MNRWKNYFTQLLDIYRVNEVRQIEIHKAQQLVPDPSPSEVKTAIATLKKHKSPGGNHIPAEMIQAGGET